MKEKIVKEIIRLGKEHRRLRMPALVAAALFLVAYHGVRNFFLQFRYHPVRQRILVGMLILALLAGQIGMMNVMAESNAAAVLKGAGDEGAGNIGTRTIVVFSKLPDDVREQTVPVGTGIEELTLPDTLEVVVAISEDASLSEQAPTSDGSDVPEEVTKDTADTESGDAGQSAPSYDQSSVEEGAEASEESGTEGSAEAPEESGTEESTEAPEESGTEGSAEIPEESSTGESAEAPEESGTEGSTEAPEESSTEESTEAPEESSTEESTEAPEESGTGESAEAPEESGTEESAEVSEESKALEENAVWGAAGNPAETETEVMVETVTVGLPEYYAEPEEQTVSVLPQSGDAGNVQEAKPVTISVTWQSDPEYNENTVGEYVFTPILPKGYALAEGVSVPKITVTVEEMDEAAEGILGNSMVMLAAATSISGNISSSQTWSNGDTVGSAVTISGGSVSNPVVITVNGTVTVNAQIEIKGCVKFAGGGTLKRGSTGFDNIFYLSSDEASLTIDGVTIDGDNISSDGLRAIYMANGSVTMNSGTIQNCVNGSSDGSVAYMSGGTFTVNGGAVQNNQSSSYGGAFYVFGGELTINGGTFRNNSTTSTSSYGGGCIYNRNVVMINGGIFTGNSSTRGGAVYNTSYGTLTITGGSFSENTATTTDGIYYYGNGIFHSSRHTSGSSILNIGGNASIADQIYLDASNSAKTINVTSVLKYPITVAMSNTSAAENRVVAEGSSYTLTKQDMSRLSIINDGWYFKLSENNILLTKTRQFFDVSVTGADPGHTVTIGDVKLDDNGSGTYTGQMEVGTYDVLLDGSKVGSITVSSGGGNSFHVNASLTVTFNANGGLVSTASKTVTAGSTYGELPTPTRAGYTFNGWYTSKTGGSKITSSDTVTVTADQTLYAQWTVNQYDVAFDANGGTVGATSGKVTYGSTYGPLPTPTRTGYTFAGWYTSASGGTKVESGTKVAITANQTLYAHWKDDIKPVISLKYNYEPKTLWDWLIGKDSLTITVTVDEQGSGADSITYTVTPDGAAAQEPKTVTLSGSAGSRKAEFTVEKDFKGTVRITCADRAGNEANVTVAGPDRNASGIIIEDHAPEITIDAEEDTYYEAAPTIRVTVTDDTVDGDGNAVITAGIDTVTYRIGAGGAERSVSVDKTDLQAALKTIFDVPASEIPTGSTKITITAVDNAGNETTKSITVNVKGPEETPQASIDYEKETLKGLEAGKIYKVGIAADDGTVSSYEELTADDDGCIPVKKEWLGQKISVVKAGDGNDGAAKTVIIPGRPGKPTPSVTGETAPGKKDGKLAGLDAGRKYQISTDGGKTWTEKTADADGELTGLAPGSYVVRVSPTDTDFAGEICAVVSIEEKKAVVTFMADGARYAVREVSYGQALTDIPAVSKKDAENRIFVGEWCVDEQGSSLAVFTNITADMTVYAVYVTAYTVTLQGGTGYTLSAVNGSSSPVKEGGSFTFRYVLSSGYQEGNGFAVNVNGMKVTMTADGKEGYTCTMTDIRENKTVTVAGVEKVQSTGGSDDSGGGDGDSDREDADVPQPTPQPAERPVSRPRTEAGKPDNRQPEEGSEPESTETVEPEPAGQQAEAEKEQQTEGDPERTIPASIVNGRIVVSDEPVQTGNVKDMTSTSTALNFGNGAIIVTVVCQEQVYTAGVADTVAVANAVLKQEQLELVGNGETIEIKIEVTDISDSVPQQDMEVIERGVEEYHKEIPGLTLGVYVDLSLFIKFGEGDWDAITASREPIEVIIGVPEGLQEAGRTFYIIRSHEGEYTFMSDMDDEQDTITISTDMFSSYAIAYVQTDVPADGNKKCGLCHVCPTFLGMCCFMWLAIIVGTILVIWIVIRKKRREQEKQA